MTVWLCVTPEREQKTRMLMTALAAGIGRESRVVVDVPPDDGNPFVVWGQEWLTMRTVPEAHRRGRPYWTIDNGYWSPGRGKPNGYYRFCYRGMSPVLLPKSLPLRSPTVILRQWHEPKPDAPVLLAMPGMHFGQAIGVDVRGWCTGIADAHGWCAGIVERIHRKTDRRIRLRLRDSRKPLADDMRGVWCCVTHSSNVAVDAVIAGIPVFVEPTSAAAPVGRTDLEIEEPVTPGRKQWLASLASQHFTVPEMRAGIAWQWMQRIAEHVDSGREDRAA